MRTLDRIVAFATLLLGCVCLADSVEPLNVPPEGKAGFTRLEALKTGISFTNQLSDARAATNRNLLSGSGVAAGDIDNDGNIDLFFCALDNSNALYRNLGNWRFENITASSPSITLEDSDCTGAAFADVDGDGDLDLLVNALGKGTQLFLNDGKGGFSPKTDSGLQTHAGSTSLALADIDGDSDLDLYVCNFRPTTIRDDPTTKYSVGYIGDRPVVLKVNGRPATAPDLTNRFLVAANGLVIEQGEADVLYENDGAGRFTAISFTSGRFREANGEVLKQAPFDWGLAVQMRDFTGDGAPDIYVCNDYWTPDRIWINDGRGNFHAAPLHAFRTTSYSSMGVDFADLDRNGTMDCVVLDMLSRQHKERQVQVADVPDYHSVPGEIWTRFQLPQNTVQLNRGDGTFAEIGRLCGLEASEWSWNPIFLDVDFDGWEDLLVSNGHRRDFQNMDATSDIQNALKSKRLTFADRRAIMEIFPGLNTTNAAFRNNGDLTFSDMGAQWGLNSPAISHGSCLADLDNDGDMDLVVNNLGSSLGVYRNDATAPRVLVRLKGTGKNRHGIGAQIFVGAGSLVQTQEILGGGRYLSSDAPERSFALPESAGAWIEIRWRDGQKTRIADVKANSRHVISHPAAR
ncbi:MAG TPA: CRTAC1 family protein [Verrucomicrobiae bacterium]